MAPILEFICPECGKPKHEIGRICAACRSLKYRQDKAAHRARLNEMTLEQRLVKIEDMLYELDADARLKALEVQHIRY